MRRMMTLTTLIGILIALPVVQAVAAERESRGPRTRPIDPPTTGPTVPIDPSPTTGGINRVSLGCYIDTNGRLIHVGNPRAPAIPKGTLIFFSGKIDNGDMYSGRVPAREDIPPHLFILLMYNPRFDPSVPCKAWLELPPVALP